MLIDTSHLTVEELKGMFSFAMISFKDLDVELKKRSLCMDIHGDIRYQDGELYGEISDINKKQEPPEKPIENRWEILDL